MESYIKHINPRGLTSDVGLQTLLVSLLNIIENQSGEIDLLKAEVALLKDEINRLKGEDGRPNFKPPKDRSSTSGSQSKKGGGKSRNKNHKKGKKKKDLPIDRHKFCQISEDDLPEDAVFKYYDEIIQQDVVFHRQNTCYHIGVYYSPSKKKTYQAPYPSDYVGSFGLGVRVLSQLLHHYCDVTQSRLWAFWESAGISISNGSINNILQSSKTWALEEQRQLLEVGIAQSPYTQMDSTKSMERGVRKATQIICGEYFSVFYTMDDKTRLSVIKALLGKPSDGLQVAYNPHSQALLSHFGVAKKDQALLATLYTEGQVLPLAAFEANMAKAAPSICEKKNMYPRIKESLVLGYYHTQTDFPAVDTLLSDDAGEYKKIAKQAHALCWIHDVRFYKKFIKN